MTLARITSIRNTFLSNPFAKERSIRIVFSLDKSSLIIFCVLVDGISILKRFISSRVNSCKKLIIELKIPILTKKGNYYKIREKI